MIVVNKPPNTDNSLFFDDLDRIFTKMNSENKYIFLLGDVNFDTFRISHFKLKSIHSDNLSNMLSYYNLCKLINRPTRVKPPFVTLLDNFYTNIPITFEHHKSVTLSKH